uniref:Ephrin RBD domain-containing protein n=1 Tax=Steinernema glaseri TaxID=37863 RepID=A0A1I8A1F7_9BILA
MDSVPVIFTRAVVSQIAVVPFSLSWFHRPTNELQKLASPCWASEAARYAENKWLYSLTMAPPFSHGADYQVLVSRRKSASIFEEYIRIDNFDTFDVGRDVLWSSVKLWKYIPRRNDSVLILSTSANVPQHTFPFYEQRSGGVHYAEHVKPKGLRIIPKRFPNKQGIRGLSSEGGGECTTVDDTHGYRFLRRELTPQPKSGKFCYYRRHPQNTSVASAIFEEGERKCDFRLCGTSSIPYVYNLVIPRGTADVLDAPGYTF